MNIEIPEPRTDLTALKASIEEIKSQIGKVVMGQHEMVDLLLAALLIEGHVLIEGVPGLAKTLSAKAIAKCLNAAFSRIQFTPDLMPSDVTGTIIYNSRLSDFEYRKGPVFTNLLLVDEINRAPAKTQAALFEAMEERQVTADGITHPLPRPFMVMATQNPIEQEGTYRLPEAQLDRFLFHIILDYPTENEELQILETQSLRSTKSLDSLLAPVIDAAKLTELQGVVKNLHIEQSLMQYIVSIVRATRVHRFISLGASPRASLNIANAARAMAAMDGRDYVIPEDVKIVLPSVLSHRLQLTPDKEMEGIKIRDLIGDISNSVAVPR